MGGPITTWMEGFKTANPSKNLGILCSRSRKIGQFLLNARWVIDLNAIAIPNHAQYGGWKA